MRIFAVCYSNYFPREIDSIKRQVTISNTGPAAVVFGGLAKTTGDFSAVSHCGSTLGVGQSCTIDLAFTPAQLGERQGLLTVPLASPGEQISVPLIAQAVPGVWGYNYPYCMEFEPTMVGSSSFPQTAYVFGYDESGTGAGLGLDTVLCRSPAFAIAGEFCNTDPYGYYNNCEVDVEFRPTQVGPVMGRMILRSNSENPLADVWLLGTGYAGPAGRLSRSTSLLDFGYQDLGLTSAPQSIRLTNTSTVPTEVAGVAAPPDAKALVAYGAPVTINSITISGDYAQDNNCRTLDPGESCTIDVTFTPTAMGDRPGVVTVESDATNSVLTVSLTGIGSTPLPGIQKSLIMGVRDHIAICGHRPKSGYNVIKDPETGIASHAIQVASYKIYDRYAKSKGFRDQTLSPCVVTVVDTNIAPEHPDMIKVFWDAEEGASYLKWNRRKK